uniref:endothelin-converting enzyme 2-like n=1 Tax=Myxine glutinosa TaxID=7769 RepID=UPI00358F17BC
MLMDQPHRRQFSGIQRLFFFSRSRSTWHGVFWMVLMLTLLALFGTVLTFTIWNHTRRHTTGKREHQALCLTPSCIMASGVLIRFLNRSVDPCDDFYTFACGGWLRDNPRPPKEDRWGQFEVLKMNNLNSLHKLIGNSELRTDSEAIQKTRLFYSACMHRKNLFKGGIEQLQHIIDQECFFTQMSRPMMQVNNSVSDLHNYFLWSLVRKLLPHLDPMLERLNMKLQQALYGKGLDDDKPQWKFCTETTNQAFGLSLGLLFAKGRFSSALRREVEDMIQLIKQGFGSNLDSLTWLDMKTRDAAKEKMERMREHIGFPEEAMKPKLLDKFYAKFRVSEEHFSNMLEFYKFESHQLSMSLRTTDSGNHRWTMLPQTGNTYYSSIDNSMVFPAGVLQSPLYHSDYPMSINFGALGSIIGHELSHAFDNQGRRFNAKGDLKNWWTKTALVEFKNRTACLANWFEKYSAAGDRVNGQQTLGENIADGGGLRAAYTAYSLWEKEHGPEDNLPAVNLTRQQLFFTAFAQTWCSSESESFLQEQLREGKHSPARFRVLGTLSNSPEFSQHFHCPLDSPMNPSTKCSLW